MTARYFLRTTDAQGRAYGRFQWPLEVGAIVEAPDWRDDAECGGGLHGLENGNGDGSLLGWLHDALWWVVSTDADTPVVPLGGKQKFPRCRVEIFGDRKTVTDWLVARGCTGVHGANVSAGTGGTATAGTDGTATAGECGTATAGYRGTATAGYRGTATAGECGTATAGHRGTATAGECGTATAGDCGTATAGHRGTATAGDEGTATAGHGGTATAGHGGTATAGYRGTATAGECGIIQIKHWNGGRYRIVTGYVGENGIRPGVAYKLDGAGNFVEAGK